MTTKTFKQKAPTVQAIEVTDLLTQASEVANLIGSQAYQVDISKAMATFVLGDGASLAVGAAQVVSMLDGSARAWDAKDFYSFYEQV